MKITSKNKSLQQARAQLADIITQEKKERDAAARGLQIADLNSDLQELFKQRADLLNKAAIAVARNPSVKPLYVKIGACLDSRIKEIEEALFVHDALEARSKISALSTALRTQLQKQFEQCAFDSIEAEALSWDLGSVYDLPAGVDSDFAKDLEKRLQ